MEKDQANSVKQQKATQLDFLSILLYKAWQNTKTVKTFQQWQEHLYKQILKDHEKVQQPQEQQTTQVNQEKQQSKNQ